MKIWTLVLITLLAIGCGDDNTPAGPTTGPPPADPALMTVAQRSAPPPPTVNPPRGPRTHQLIVLRSMEVGETRQFDSTCADDWESSDDSIATVDRNGLVTAESVGTVRITEVCPEEGNSSVRIRIVAAPEIVWSPEPPTEAQVGVRSNGFGANIDRGREGWKRVEPYDIWSSDRDIFTVEFDGDNHWTITPKKAGRADILVRRLRSQDEGEDGDTRTYTGRIVEELTRTVVVREATTPPPPTTPSQNNYDYEIVNVARYDASIDRADWLKFRWISRTTARSFRVKVTFLQGSIHSSCDEYFLDPTPGAASDETTIPDICGVDEPWSEVRISPADGRNCKGCGTFRWTDIPLTDLIRGPERTIKRLESRQPQWISPR